VQIAGCWYRLPKQSSVASGTGMTRIYSYGDSSGFTPDSLLKRMKNIICYL